jgi:DNA polymerase-1
LNIPTLYKESYEADDIIGTISSHIKKSSDIEGIIFSNDKDLLQLIDSNIFVLKQDKNATIFTKYDENSVVSNIGIKPSQVIDYLALIGDTADNIPGVKGIGPKGAVELLAKYETLDNIFKFINEIPVKLQGKLFLHKDDAFISQRLATIDKNVDMPFDFNNFLVNRLSLSNAKTKLQQEGLFTIIKDIEEYNNDSNIIFTGNEKIESVKSVEKKVSIPSVLLYKRDDLDEVSNEIRETTHFAFSIQTSGDDFFNDKIVAITIFYSIGNSNKNYTIPIYIGSSQQKSINITLDDTYIKDIREFLNSIFSDSSIIKVGSDLKINLKFLKSFGISVSGELFDVMLASYSLDGSNNVLGLNQLVDIYLSYSITRYEELVGNSKTDNFQTINIDKLAQYSGENSFAIYELYNVLKDKLKENKKTEELFYLVEMKLLEVLIDMEYNGIHINKDYLNNLTKKIGEELTLIEDKLEGLVDEKINLNSPKQVAKILFEKLNLPVIKKTKTGYSTDVDVLNKLKYIHPVPSLLLEYRELEKIRSTYSSSLPNMINTFTNKIHTTYIQTGTETGRLASRNPNLQNIPIKSELGRMVRIAFIPSKDNLILSADYSQIELFLLAEFSKDKNLCKAFVEEIDIHNLTASLIYNKNIDEVSKNERKIGKTVNFGVLYGQGPFALSEELNIQLKDAKEFINKYFIGYNGVSLYINSIKEECKKKGYILTYWGRKRSIPEINDKNKIIQSKGERMAVNSTIQGTAADLIKIAMIRIHKALNLKGMKSKLVMQVHDELIFDVVKEEKDELITIVKECMEDGYGFSLKLKTSIEIGNNWGELH